MLDEEVACFASMIINCVTIVALYEVIVTYCYCHHSYRRFIIAVTIIMIIIIIIIVIITIIAVVLSAYVHTYIYITAVVTRNC